MAADDSDEDGLLAEAMEGASDAELLDEDFDQEWEDYMQGEDSGRGRSSQRGGKGPGGRGRARGKAKEKVKGKAKASGRDAGPMECDDGSPGAFGRPPKKRS